MKKYARRPHYWLNKICECGHTDLRHSDTKWGYSFGTGECKECMCPKYKYESTYKEEKKGWY